MKKKVLSLLLALTLCVGFVIPASALTVNGVGVDPGLYKGVDFDIEIGVDGSAVLAGERNSITGQQSGFTITISRIVKITSEPFGSSDNLQDVIWLPSDGATITFTVDPNSVSMGNLPVFDENNEVIDHIVCAICDTGDYVLDEDGIYMFDGGGIGYLNKITKPQGTFSTELKGEAEKWVGRVSSYGYGNAGFKYSFTDETASPAADTPSSWAAESVSAAISAGLVPESLQSKYTAATTRAEFCALAVALYETVTGKEIAERAQFGDTTDVNVQKMAGLGVVNGVGDNKFAPGNKLTREQAATMLSRLASVIGKPLTEQAPTFADSASVSIWATAAVGQMQATGIMGGVGNNAFSPATDYTREQSMITMKRLFDIVK